jgi:agmatinase
MANKTIPMVPGRKNMMPTIYGDTPSFLGVPIFDINKLPKGLDVVVAGVPWEGTITWGTFSGCELAPRAIRHASARYGGYLPEYDIDIFDHIKIGDIGDISVDPGNAKRTMTLVFKTAKSIYKNGSIPLVLGGDHSFTPEIVRALGNISSEKVGIIHFDSHFDNLKNYGKDEFPRCGPIYRISELPNVDRQSIVHIGIRGPRNAKAQYGFAKKIGATIFDINQIHQQGINNIIDQAISIVKKRAENVYVTICSDCLDIAYNAGGPIDFNGLTPQELFFALFRLGEEGIAGIDFVEVYPLSDPRSISSHLAAWSLIYALAGIAKRKQKTSHGRK